MFKSCLKWWFFGLLGGAVCNGIVTLLYYSLGEPLNWTYIPGFMILISLAVLVVRLFESNDSE